MSSSLKQFKARALARPGVKNANDALKQEFSLLGEVLRARTSGVIAMDSSKAYSFSHDRKV